MKFLGWWTLISCLVFLNFCLSTCDFRSISFEINEANDFFIGDLNRDAYMDIVFVSNNKKVSNAIGPYDASPGGVLFGTSQAGQFQRIEFFRSHDHLSYDRVLPIDHKQWMLIPNVGNLTVARLNRGQ